MKRQCVKYGLWTVAVFVVACYLLFATVLYRDGCGLLMPWEVFADGVLLAFMAVWSLLVFYCGYGLRKEFLEMRNAALREFPDLSEEVVSREARREFGLKYLKLLFPVFCLLPLAYLAASSTIPPTLADYVVMGLSWTAAAVVFVLRKRLEAGKDGTPADKRRSGGNWGRYVVWYGVACVLVAVFLLPRPIGWLHLAWLLPVMGLVVFVQYVFKE